MKHVLASLNIIRLVSMMVVLDIQFFFYSRLNINFSSQYVILPKPWINVVCFCINAS